jgi:hypothetical protein
MKKVIKRLSAVFMLVLLIGLSSTRAAAAPQQSGGQQPTQQTNAAAVLDRVVGTVAAIDASAGRMDVKTDTGEMVGVLLNARVGYLRLAPGQETLEKAAKAALTDIKVGDRVYARGKLAVDKKSMAARQVIIIAQADIGQQHEKVRQDWQQRGVAGVISTVDSQKQEITLQIRGRESTQPLIITTNQNTQFRRYPPDSIKFSDTQPSSIEGLKIGDQLRALGNKSADGTHLTGEEVISGSFLTIGGTVTAVDVEKGEIQINTFKDKSPVTIALSKDSTLRRIPPQMAPIFAQKPAASGAGGSAAAPAAPVQAQPANGTTPVAAPARPANRSADLQEAFERLPSVTLAEIKPGEMIVVSSTKGANPSRVTAISVITGLEAVLRLAQAPARGGRPAPNPNTGLPSGVLDFALTLP